MRVELRVCGLPVLTVTVTHPEGEPDGALEDAGELADDALALISPLVGRRWWRWGSSGG